MITLILTKQQMKKILAFLLVLSVSVSCTKEEKDSDIASWNSIAINGDSKKLENLELEKQFITSDWANNNMQFAMALFSWDDIEEKLGGISFNEIQLIMTVYPESTPPFETETSYQSFSYDQSYFEMSEVEQQNFRYGKGDLWLKIEDSDDNIIFVGDATNGQNFKVEEKEGDYYITINKMKFQEKNIDNTWGSKTITFSAKLIVQD